MNQKLAKYLRRRVRRARKDPFEAIYTTSPRNPTTIRLLPFCGRAIYKSLKSPRTL